ncbi:MAG: peptide chain release factor N(5)-glutamine methyltransferase, partial [Micrococcales bacterium]|nr:peptide chain release factor N(5)-glutamine methyltransferase [Micrococcales bacterium]
RPETEGLVQLVLDWLATQAIEAPVIVDLGTGSGAIAKSLARESHGRVHAVESSAEALAYARRNLPAAVDLRLGDWSDTFKDLDGKVDVVVSNPPYVPGGEQLPADVAGYDPPAALFAGADGLDCLRSLIPVAHRLLRSGGLLACEHDESQGESLPRLIADDGGFANIADHADLTGRPRYVTAEIE